MFLKKVKKKCFKDLQSGIHLSIYIKTVGLCTVKSLILKGGARGKIIRTGGQRMDVMSIASLGMAMSTSRMMVDVNMALMAKTQDLAEIQGQEIQNMIEAAAPSFHALDVYA